MYCLTSKEFNGWFVGHPNLLWLSFLKFNPKNSFWVNRDRFVLSNGHGSMLLYALLYLCGYDSVTLEDIKKFRHINSRTPGHPENIETAGVEVTTGPLGQGMSTCYSLILDLERDKELQMLWD